MKRTVFAGAWLCVVAGCQSSDGGNGGTACAPGDLDVQLCATDAKLVATVDERFQSFNVEMVEVTGGRFWAPYGSGGLYEEREPIDLTNPRLRNLARELAPAFMRVSGSWANGTYYDLDESTDGTTPDGFVGVVLGHRPAGCFLVREG